MRARRTAGSVAASVLVFAMLGGAGHAGDGDRPYDLIEQPTLMDLVLNADFLGAWLGEPALPVFGCETEQCLNAVAAINARYVQCRTSYESHCMMTDILRAYVRTIFGDDDAGAAFIRYAERDGATCERADITVCTYWQRWCAPPLLYFLSDDELIRSRLTIYVDPGSAARPIVRVVLDQDRRPISSSEYEACVLTGRLPY